jgi:RNA polymerase sigma-70 factor (ECF subfamily)
VINVNNDAVLIEISLNGDIEAFSALVCKYQDRLYNFFMKMNLSREDSEEIVQEVFIKVYNNLYRYNSNWSFSTWLYRIAVNTLRSEYKKKKKIRLIDYYADIQEVAGSSLVLPDESFEIKEQTQEIIKLIDSLSHDQKLAFTLRYVQDFSFKEIGDILGISPEAAKMKIQRAKQTLCKKFEKLQKERV